MNFIKSLGYLFLPLFALWGAFEMFKEATQEVNEVSDFGTITGTLKFAEEYHLKKSTGMTFYINESHVRFRVGPTSYGIFDHDAFFKNVRIGTRITLTALLEDIANPTPPSLGKQIDTTFVYGLKDSQFEYLKLSKKLAQQENKVGFWILAIFFGIMGVVFLLGSIWFIWLDLRSYLKK